MKDIEWRAIDRSELAVLLGATRRVASRAVGTTTVYRLEDQGRATLAIALPDGQAIVVALAAPTARQRRRIDPKDVTPASR